MEIPYVSEESLKMAKEIEKKFCDLPTMSNLIFVGVHPIPTFGGKVSSFKVQLGFLSKMAESTGEAVADEVFKSYKDLHFSVTVFRGVPGPAAKALDNR